jgi:lantibiotic leader peptide-processing serine protease
VLSTSGPAQYYFAAGTSMASPHVAGVAALIVGKYGHGALTPAQVKAKLKAGADDLGKPGKDPYFGMGRVNAFKSLQ